MISLDEVTLDDADFLYNLLKERSEITNFSENKIPTFEEHIEFIKSNPYQKWYIVKDNNLKVGSVNLDKNDGVGTFILKKFQNKGYGTKAMKKIISLNPRKKYYANINPNNENSIKLYTKMGFKHIYNHYELKLKDD